MKGWLVIFLSFALAWGELLTPAAWADDPATTGCGVKSCCGAPKACCAPAPASNPVPPQPFAPQREAKPNLSPEWMLPVDSLPVALPTPSATVSPLDLSSVSLLTPVSLHQRNCVLLL